MVQLIFGPCFFCFELDWLLSSGDICWKGVLSSFAVDPRLAPPSFLIYPLVTLWSHSLLSFFFLHSLLSDLSPLPGSLGLVSGFSASAFSFLPWQFPSQSLWNALIGERSKGLAGFLLIFVFFARHRISWAKVTLSSLHNFILFLLCWLQGKGSF